MKKYLVEYRRHNGDMKRVGLNSGYDGFCDVFDTIEEANKAAITQWDHLTITERKHSEVEVLAVTEDDLADWAIDEENGEIDWTSYANADLPEGGLKFSGLNDDDVHR